MEEKPTVLPSNFSLGPHGLGDPNDRSLRRVEREVLIPKLMREKAKGKCTDEVKEFEDCCKISGFSMVIKCRKQNSELKKCIQNWYENPQFKKLCIEEYLKERSEYRQTGIKQSMKRKPMESM
ncbi:COX assembly mitochondrial protein homolog [Centruroides vittatus]|uniref:COX assembly mitochondrial protein homolog n=1 Tax=Centruroides vittatus TaxID=120091 RepID=UPI00350F05E3